MNEMPEESSSEPLLPPRLLEEQVTPSLVPSVDWEVWLKDAHSELIAYARREARSQADAEEILHEALMQLVQAVEKGKFKGDSSAWQSYVRSAIVNLAKDRGRREKTRARILKRFREELDAVEREYPEPWQRLPLDDERLRRQMDELLSSLPAEFEQVVRLRIWGGYTFQVIADKTAKNLSTVTSRYRYAMQTLRKKLSQNPLEP